MTTPDQPPPVHAPISLPHGPAICYSGYREGQDPNRKLFPSVDQIREDLHILRRHWLELGMRHGVVAADGRPAQAVVDDLVARTPEALAVVRARLPHGFPAEVADSILGGVQVAAARLAAEA